MEYTEDNTSKNISVDYYFNVESMENAYSDIEDYKDVSINGKDLKYKTVDKNNIDLIYKNDEKSYLKVSLKSTDSLKDNFLEDENIIKQLEKEIKFEIKAN